MIIPFTNRESFSREAFLICLRSSVNKATLLRRGKVKPETYAGGLLAQLHDAIFGLSVDLKRDYQEFYKIEYQSFNHYAHKRFLIPEELLRVIEEQYDSSEQIILFNSACSFLEGEYGQQFLEKLLEPKEVRK